MYLISVYFDKKTENRIQSYINDVASKCGNMFMIDNQVPPHITISSFETLQESSVAEVLDSAISNMKRDKISWVTVGAFPTVIFIQPVLNEYLHNLSSTIYERIEKISDTKINKYYQPFHWLPHATIAKQLSEEEMRAAFDVLQKSFEMFGGEIVRIELAKKNPYRVIKSWELKHE